MPRARAKKPPPAAAPNPEQAAVPLPPWLRERAGGVQLSLRIQPRASSSEVQGEFGDQLRIRIAAPPVDSAANQALVEFLANILGCSRSQIHLLRGHASRQKVVTVQGITASPVLARLQPDPTGKHP